MLIYKFIIAMSDQEKTRYFEFMRPRYSNPSFLSSNVGATLGLINVPSESRYNFAMNRSSLDSKELAKKVSTEQNHPRSRQGRNLSNLSSYGTSSLGSLPRMMSERDIYEKQQKKYNIITIQPKEYNETIKKYPIYRLENSDENYYRKLKLQEEYNPKRTTLLSNSQINPEYNSLLASKAELKKSPDTQPGEAQNAPKIRPKMLNNIDQLKGAL